jgi:aryl-alcohol dehydrogenase-like predicted oxidoreductase
MLVNPFPSLGTPVSRLGYGAFGLGGVFGAFDKTEAIDAMHAAWDRGVNLIDTARHYGASESIIAEAMQSWRGPKPFIATKAECIGPLEQWGIPVSVERCFPRGHITREADISLKTLGVDSIDLFQMHLYWPNWGVEGYWLDELEALVKAGKVKAIGVSLPDQRGDIALPLVMSGRIHSIQTVFNLWDSTPLDCVIPVCAKYKVAVLARCALDEGGLSGTLKMDTEFGPKDFRAKYFDMGPRKTYLERVDALRKFIPEHAKSLAALAIKFVLKDPGVTSALISMHVKRFAEENMRALEEPPLSDEVFNDLRRHYRWIRNFYHPKVL